MIENIPDEIVDYSIAWYQGAVGSSKGACVSAYWIKKHEQTFWDERVEGGQ